MTASSDQLLLTFPWVRGSVFDRARIAVDGLVAHRGLDPDRAAVVVGRVLSDPPGKALVLRRVGITFTAKEIEALCLADDHRSAQLLVLDRIEAEVG